MTVITDMIDPKRLAKGMWWDKVWSLVDSKWGHAHTREDRLTIPLKRRKPTVFAIWSDLFHEDVPTDFIWRVFEIIQQCPQHLFLVLTKRPEEMAVFTSVYFGPGEDSPRGRIPFFNLWLGVSAEDQATLDERVPHLLRCPAAIRFLSCEPLLGPVDALDVRFGYPDWIIIGGESGPGARPCNVEWIRDLLAQAKAAGVPAFVKQLGARITVANDSSSEWPRDGDEWIYPAGMDVGYQGERITIRLSDPKAGDMSAWPEDLRRRDWPEAAK